MDWRRIIRLTHKSPTKNFPAVDRFAGGLHALEMTV